MTLKNITTYALQSLEIDKVRNNFKKDDGKLDTCKLKKWCERKSIPLPKALRDFEEKRKTNEEK